jgi:hypothetical protein
MRYSRSLMLVLGVCIALAGGEHTAYGQVPQGQVLGTVTDSSGAAVAGANVQLMNELTGIVQTQQTNASGGFTFSYLNSGVYRLSIESSGFKTGVYPGIQVATEQKRRVDVQLQLGNVSEKVEVTGAAAQIDTDSAVVGTILSQREVTGLPLNGRDFSLLATIEPEVTFAGTQGSSIQAQLNTFVTVGGNSIVGAAYSLDGVDNRNDSWAGPAMNPSVDTIQEFRIEKSQSSAEFGGGGAQLMVVSKSGTNSFHGALWEFNRNAALNASEYYSHQKNALIRNEFGFEVGGPIIKNKLFFDFNYEGHRQRLLYQGTDTVMTEQMRTGDFSELLPDKVIVDPNTGTPFPNNVIPADRIDPVMTDMLTLMFHPTRPGIVNNLTTSIPTYSSNNQYSGRFDYKLSSKDSLFFRGTYQPRKGVAAPLFPQWMSAGEDYTFSNYGVGWTRGWTSNLVSETRFGYHRELINQVNVEPANIPAQEPQGFGSEPIDHYPIVFVDDFGSFGQGGNNVTFDTKFYELTQNVSMVRGNHLIKVGFSGQRYFIGAPFQYSNSSWPFFFFSDNVYSGLAAADLLLGLPTQGYIYTKSPPKAQHAGQYSFFAQDDWKITSYLTLNFGLRYELPVPETEENNIWGNFDPALGKIVLAGNSIQPGLGPQFVYDGYSSFLVPASETNLPKEALVYQDKNNIAPRFGFAWRPFKNNKTVVRGGYGIYYIRPWGQQQANSFTIPYGGAFSVFNTTPTPTLSADNMFNGGPTGGLPAPSAYYKDLHQPTGYSQQSSLGIQRDLPWGMTGELTVQHQNFTHIENYYNFNQAHIGAGNIESRTPYPDFSSISGIFGQGHGRYDSLTALVRKSSHHYTYQASFVWAKSIGQDIIDVYNPNQFNGPTGYVPRQLKFHFLMDVPFGKGRRWLDHGGVANAVVGGWVVSGIATPYSSGQPFNVYYNGDPANINVFTVRADRTCNGGVSNPSADRWFDASCFGPPGTGTVGNSPTGALFGPGSFSADFAVYKDFIVHEKITAQFRTEMFNIFNHPNLGAPNNVQNGFDFGQVTTVNQIPRVIQLALRITF